MSNDNKNNTFGEDATQPGGQGAEFEYIGRYRVVQKLGQGAMGDVYEGFHPELELKVAIKIINRDLLADDVLVERFKDEAKAVSNIGHPGLVRVFDLGSCPDGRLYMAMEYLNGQDLEEALARKKTFAVDDALLLATQITSALATVHDRGIIHRDIKPANLYLVDDEDNDFQIKILDFGIAKLAKKNDSGSKKTQLGQIIGTPDYMAPEQIAADGTIDHRADIYSLGCVLYELLSGQSPFEGENIQTILMAHLTETPKPLTEINPNIPLGISELIQECLSKQPDDRPADMRSLKKRFIGLVDNKQQLQKHQTKPNELVPPAPETGNLQRSKWAILAGLALVSIIGLAWMIKSKNKKNNGTTLAIDTNVAIPEQPPQTTKASDTASTEHNPYNVNDPKTVSEGALLYGTHCAKCHGDDGDGNGVDTPANITPKALNVQDIETGILDTYRYKIVNEGIPDQMPKFSNTLSTEDTWKVVTFVNTLSKEQETQATQINTSLSSFESMDQPKLTPKMKKAGSKLYKKHCRSCHGSTGKGNGRAADYLGRKPANLRQGFYKIRTTPKYSIPTNIDIFATITKGMGVHGMPSFKKLNNDERWSLVAYIKSLSKRFSKEKPEEVIVVPAPPTFTANSIKRGQELYEFSACAKCHGALGKGDGPKSGEIIAKTGQDYRLPDFSVKGSFIGGYEPREIYRTLMTGISGTPMPSGSDFFEPNEAWDVVSYIMSFSK